MDKVNQEHLLVQKHGMYETRPHSEGAHALIEVQRRNVVPIIGNIDILDNKEPGSIPLPSHLKKCNFNEWDGA